LRRIHEEEEDPMAESRTIRTRLLTLIALLLVVAALKSSYPSIGEDAMPADIGCLG
jgi:hypothetical protein